MSWMISYRRANSYGPPGKGYDEIAVIDVHPTVWVARENRHHNNVLRVYSAIEIPADVEHIVREVPEPQGDF